MKRVLLGLAAAAAISGAAIAGEAKHELLPGYLPNEQSFDGYLNNTTVIFIYGIFERHIWFMGESDVGGTDIKFEASKAPNGNVMLTVADEKWKFYDGYRARVTHTGADGVEGVPYELQDADPGDTWRLLNAQEPRRDMREIYTILPGHQ